MKLETNGAETGSTVDRDWFADALLLSFPAPKAAANFL
jgi:hypothetical protein